MKKIFWLLAAILIQGYSSYSVAQTFNTQLEFNYGWGTDISTNLVKNPSAAKSRGGTLIVGLTLTRDTSSGKKIDNRASYLIDGAAINNYLELDLNTPPDDLTSGMCVFKGEFIGDASFYSAQILDGSANVLSSVALTNETTWRGFAVPYACGAAGARKVRVTQTTAGNGAAFNAGKFTYTRYVPITGQLPNTFTANVTTGVVSDENINFINGNITLSSGAVTGSFVSGIFNVAPSCSIQLKGDSSNSAPRTSTLTTTSVGFSGSLFNNTSKSDLDFRIICVKAGSDYQPAVIMPDQLDYSEKTYSPTVTGLGAGSGTVSGTYSRNGSDAKVCIDFLKDSTNGTGSSIVKFTYPPGISLDTARTPSGGAIIGTGYTSLNNNNLSLVATSSALQFFNGNADVVGSTLTASNRIRGCVSFPVVGWTPSQGAQQLNGSYTNPLPIALKSGSVTLQCAATSVKYRDKIGISIANAVDNGTNRSCVITFDKAWGDYPDCSFTYVGIGDMKPVGIKSGTTTLTSMTIAGPDEDFIGVLKCEGHW